MQMLGADHFHSPVWLWTCASFSGRRESTYLSYESLGPKNMKWNLPHVKCVPLPFSCFTSEKPAGPGCLLIHVSNCINLMLKLCICKIWCTSLWVASIIWCNEQWHLRCITDTKDKYSNWQGMSKPPISKIKGFMHLKSSRGSIQIN